MAAESENCCSCCFGFIITMGLTALFLWLSMRVDEPKCYIDYIYVPALNKTLNSPQNSTLLFTLKLVNGNKDKGIKYDAVLLRFKIFLDSNTTRYVGNATVPEFYQGHQKKASKPSSLLAAGNLTSTVDGKVYFRVDFATAVKYKILVWYTKRHRLWGGANVEIDNSGVHRKPIRLGNFPERIESGAPKLCGRYRALLPFFVAVLLVLNAHGFT
ncbi:protein NDR1-like [Gastrolobium bilobum]|uniref:protein NDR1-like n=1 Tax=Gastrolobium bilobum TaxID=150636 RepID=UPI002AAFB5FA|nr:protein NDR1-like [Gastrolobium bilobum]